MKLWRALEEVPGWAGAQRVWREALGDELQFLRPLLEPMEELALSIPMGESEPHRIVVHDVDDIVAVCPDSGEAIPVTHDEIVLLRLSVETLFGSIAHALGLVGEPVPVGCSTRLWWLGEFVPIEGVRFPVYLNASRDAEEILSSTGHVMALTSSPTVLLTPTRAAFGPALDGLQVNKQIACVALSDLLEWEGEATFRVLQPLDHALRVFLGEHAPETTKTPKTPRFPTPAGATWSDVTVQFRDGHTVSISVGDVTDLCTCEQMGMVSKHSRKPTVQWQLLRDFADADGKLSWESPAASRRNQKRCERLRDDLQAFFGITTDPFEYDPDLKGWRANFRIVPD